MKWIETKIQDHKNPSYVDVHKAYNIIIVAYGDSFRVRAFFPVSQNAHTKDKLFQPYFVDISEHKTREEAIASAKELCKGFLIGENQNE